MNALQNTDGVYIVLGASGDIGSCVARRLRESGYTPVLASRESDRLCDLSIELNAPRKELEATELEEVEACFAWASQEFGRVIGAVNCVGSVLLKPAHLTSHEEWENTVATNLTSAFATVRAAAKTMSDAGGSVVLLSSAAARVGLPSHEAIAAAKAGVTGLAQSAAASYAGRNLRFNVVSPGLVKSKLTKKIWGSPRAAANSTAMHALGRIGEPDEVASLIHWLLQPSNSWVTGEVFAIDGGLGNVRGGHRQIRK